MVSFYNLQLATSAGASNFWWEAPRQLPDFAERVVRRPGFNPFPRLLHKQGKTSGREGTVPIHPALSTQTRKSLRQFSSFPPIAILTLLSVRQYISIGKAERLQGSLTRFWITGSWIRGTGRKVGGDLPAGFRYLPSPPKEGKEDEQHERPVFYR